MVSDEIDTTAAATNETELKFTLAPEVPTEKSTIRVPPDVTSVPHVAVPVASAEASLLIALAVMTPPLAAPNGVADIASSASFT